MPAIFISHSSADRKVSGDIKAALDRLGFEHPFLDFDKVTGLNIGENWEKRLYEELSRCHAVLLVVTPAWLASKWCFAELTQARALGKVILPVLCEPLGGGFVLPDIQAVDLVDWNAGGLERLEMRLRAISDELARGFTLDPKRPPYPGINAFEAADAAIYFGRDEESRAVIERLDARRTQGGARFVVIIGASGSGKSSLLKASVLPLLNQRRAQWVVLPDIRPEKAPMEALAKTMAQFIGKPETWREWYDDLIGPYAIATIDRFVQDARIGEARSANVLLPIDQFEEAFTTTPASERAAFLDLLSSLFARDVPLMVIATGRSDVLEGLIESSELVGHYETFPLTAMPLERYPRLVEGPAVVAGITVEKGLSERICRDVESNEALPLLAHMLALLYQRGGADKKLNLDEYEALGDPARGLNPIQNSIRLAADEAIAHVKSGERELAALRDAFVPHLVRVRLDDGKRVRQTARRSELPQEALHLIGTLTEARLLTTRSDTDGQEREPLIEVTHESLFKAWPTLDQWLNEEQAFLTDLERIRDAHENWSKVPDDQQSGELLYGLLLSRAREWLIRYPQRFISRDMEPLRAFIAASAEVADAEQARQAEREAREKRIQRRLMFGAFTTAAILLLIAGFAGWEYHVAELQRQRAEEQRNEALVTQSRFLTDQAQQVFDKGDHGTAIALALEALPDARHNIVRPYVPAAESMLYQSVVALRDQGKLQDQSSFYGASFSVDGRRIVTRPGITGVPLVWDAVSGHIIAKIDGCRGVSVGFFSPDGKWIVVACDALMARIFDADTGALVRELSHDASLRSASFSPDGRWVMTTSADNTVRLWSVAGGPPVRVLTHEMDVLLSPDGRQTFTDKKDVRSVLFSPDGRQIVTTSNDGVVRIWDIDADSPPTILDKPTGILTAAFTPEGLRIVTNSDDGTIRIWDGPREIIALRHPKPVDSAKLSMDGRRLVTFKYRDQQARVWPIDGVDSKILMPDQSITLDNDRHIADATFSPDGQLVLIRDEKAASLWDTRLNGRIAEFGLHKDGIYSAEFSRDGRQIVTAGHDSVRIWDARDGAAVRILHGHENTIPSVAFSADGQRIVSASTDHTARVWDTVSGVQLAMLEHPSDVRGAAFLPDGHNIVTGGGDGTLRIWDMTTKGPPEALPQGHGIILSVVASSDGKRIVVAYQNEIAHLWDPVTRAAAIELGGYQAPVRSAADARDGRRVVAVAGRVLLRNAASDAGLEPVNQGGAAAALSPDGRRVAIGNGDGLLTILNADDQSHPTLISWQAHDGAIVRVAFSPDGKRIVTTSAASARIWDSATGAEVALLNGHRFAVSSAAFSPDGQRIVTASDDHTVRIWPAFSTTQALIDYARSVMPRRLTDEQRKQYFLNASAGAAAGLGSPAR